MGSLVRIDSVLTDNAIRNQAINVTAPAPRAGALDTMLLRGFAELRKELRTGNLLSLPRSIPALGFKAVTHILCDLDCVGQESAIGDVENDE